MKSKRARDSFQFPPAVGAGEAIILAHGTTEQVDLFREALTPYGKMEVLVLMAMSDPNRLDRPQIARVADIAREMGYEPGPGGQVAGSVYEDIIATGWKLKVKSFDIVDWIPVGKRADGYRKSRPAIITMSIFQEFGRYYEDDEGQQIDPEDIPKHGVQIIEKDTPTMPIYMIPMMDEKGNILKDRRGKVRVHRANGISWIWSNRFQKMTLDPDQAWIIYSNIIPTLRGQLQRPAAFNLIWMTLFWRSSVIEISHERLIEHLNIRSKDPVQVQKAIDAAFQAAFDEGIIYSLPTVKEKGFYGPTKKTGRPRRVGKVYRWRKGGRLSGREIQQLDLADVKIDDKKESGNS